MRCRGRSVEWPYGHEWARVEGCVLVVMMSVCLAGVGLADGAEGESNGGAIRIAGRERSHHEAVVDTIELRGLIRDDCRGVPECCVTEFCLERCGLADWEFLWSSDVELRPLVGQEVRVVGFFFACGLPGCWDVFNVDEAVAAPCSTMAVEPVSWGRVNPAVA